MRKFIATLLIAVTLMFTATGCTDRVKCGVCIGISDVDKPGVTYKYNAFNIALAIIFMETIIVPIIVVLDDLKCPIKTPDCEE